MNYIYSKRFKRGYGSLSNVEKKQVNIKLKIMEENQFHPSLRTKKIKGEVQLFECSVNMDIRIIWHYEDGDIYLLDIGHHNILNLY